MKKILLLHGAIGASDQLIPIAEKLGDKFDIHRLNFSGHGGGILPREAFSIKFFSNDVLKWMDLLSIKKIDIFGYSMGGYVALYLAKNYPDRIGKIFTFATKFEWTEEGAEKESKRLIPEKIEEKLPVFAQALKQRHAPADWKAVLTNTAGMMREMGKNNPLKESDFSDIEGEVMVSVGDSDKMVSHEETINVYKKFKKGSLTVFPNTPHPIEQIDVLMLSNAIKKFMEG